MSTVLGRRRSGAVLKGRSLSCAVTLLLCHHEAALAAEDLHFPPGRKQIPRTRIGRSYWFFVYFASTIGICDASWSWIMRSTRWSIWQNSAVFFAEMTFSKIGTYFIRSAITFCSLAASRLM